jgi:hypothetical protein
MDPPLVFMSMVQDAIKLLVVVAGNILGLELQSLLVLIAIRMHALCLNKVFLRRGIFQITCRIWNKCCQLTHLNLWKSAQVFQALASHIREQTDPKGQWREGSK